MLVYGKYECFVKQMLYVCVLCASCGSSPPPRFLRKCCFIQYFGILKSVWYGLDQYSERAINLNLIFRFSIYTL